MMKEGIQGLRRSYKDNQPRLRTSVGVAQAAIEFKIIELKQFQCTIFHVNSGIRGLRRSYRTSCVVSR